MFGNKRKTSITLDKNVDICVTEYAKRIHKSKSFVVNNILAQFVLCQRASLKPQNNVIYKRW